jgi:hypothetical protein
MLQTVANGLGELKEDMVFVGGYVAELYATDPATSDIRPTMDVDCVIELSSRRAHAELEENLRARRFKHDTSQGAPICRWVFAGVIVIETALPYGSDEESTDIILELIQRIAEIEQ